MILDWNIYTYIVWLTGYICTSIFAHACAKGSDLVNKVNWCDSLILLWCLCSGCLIWSFQEDEGVVFGRI